MGRRFAFTSVELLVVVAILAVLIAMLFPALSSARQAAQQAVCLNALRQHGTAAAMYRVQYRTYLPAKIGLRPDQVPQGYPSPTYPLTSWCWMPEYHEFLGLHRVTGSRFPAALVCPRATLALASENREGMRLELSYGYNVEGLSWLTRPPVYYSGYAENTVRRPAERLMFADATDWAIDESNSGAYLTYGEAYGSPPLTNITAYRHQRGANVLYFDGHSATLPASHVINNRTLWRVSQ